MEDFLEWSFALVLEDEVIVCAGFGGRVASMTL